MAQSLPPDAERAQFIETIESARTGDQQAFTQLYEHYSSLICTYLAHLVGNSEVGRDLTQETFIRAWKGLAKLQDSLSFRAWLYRIATNVARSYLQRERLAHWLPWVENERGTAESVPSIAGPEEQTGEREYIAQVLAGLSPQ